VFAKGEGAAAMSIVFQKEQLATTTGDQPRKDSKPSLLSVQLRDRSRSLTSSTELDLPKTGVAAAVASTGTGTAPAATTALPTGSSSSSSGSSNNAQSSSILVAAVSKEQLMKLSTSSSPPIISPHRLSDEKADSVYGLHVQEILKDFLFIGGEKVAKDLKTLQQLGIGAIVNVSLLIHDFHPNQFLYFRVPVEDDETEDILSYLPEACQFIDQAKQKNARVLVHCYAGHSRSATVIAAYLIAYCSFTAVRALAYITDRRPAVKPNVGFVKQLTKFEEQATKDQMATASSSV